MVQSPALFESLTEREFTVLELMSRGQTNREIVNVLVLSVETVRWYTKQIYSKLGVHSRAQAILRAQDLRLFDNETPEATQATPLLSDLPIFNLSFIGRDADLDRLCDLLAREEVRLVTVVGPGGIGKTRTAAAAARRVAGNFAEGVKYIDLSNATSIHDAYAILAERLGLRIDGSQEERILRYLNERSMLLIFDNIEQVASYEGIMRDLLSHATSIKMLVASQTALNLKDEWLHHLEGFPLPDGTQSDSERNSAVQLFAARAIQVRGNFPLHDHLQAVIEICNLVDGIPLAIELAAVWVKTLPCEAIASQIKTNIDFLTTGDQDVDHRHRSMRAVFDYSWQLLSVEEKGILRRLSVFRGHFGFEVAQQVALVTPHHLAGLVDKSLLSQGSDGSYRMHALLRQYAEDWVLSIDIEDLSTRSTIMVTWLNLMRGNIDKAEDAAKSIIERRANDKSAYEAAFEMALLGLITGIRDNYDQCRQLCQASLYLIHQNPRLLDPVSTIFAHIGMSMAASGQHDYLTVRRHLATALSEAIKMKLTVFKLICLPIAAILMAHEAEFEHATELLAQSFSHAATPGWMNEWSLLIRLRDELKNELGKTQYDHLWERGKLGSVDSIATALYEALASGT